VNNRFIKEEIAERDEKAAGGPPLLGIVSYPFDRQSSEGNRIRIVSLKVLKLIEEPETPK
jgi:hypothetical protein